MPPPVAGSSAWMSDQQQTNRSPIHLLLHTTTTAVVVKSGTAKPTVGVSCGTMDTRDAAAEAAKLAVQIGSATADALSLIADLGEELPVIQPVLKTLRVVREKLETAKGNRRSLVALHERCTYITACVIEKCKWGPSSAIDVTPLVECVEAVDDIVVRCGRRGMLLRALKASSDRDEIAELNARVDRLTGDLGLAGIAILVSAISSLLPPFHFTRRKQAFIVGIRPIEPNPCKRHFPRTPHSQPDRLGSCAPKGA